MVVLELGVLLGVYWIYPAQGDVDGGWVLRLVVPNGHRIRMR